MFLTPAEAEAVDARVTEIEARTDVQIVTSVAGKSDAYAELPWTAFALGASLTAAAIVFADAWRPDWVTAQTALVQAVLILGVAAAAALLAVLVPPFARLFLRDSRRDGEVRQYAESLFLRRELFATARRRGVLIFVSLFERRIEILPDAGLRQRVTEAEWQTVVGRMTAAFHHDRPAQALLEGLDALETLLVGKGFPAPEAGPNELPNRPIEERGV